MPLSWSDCHIDWDGVDTIARIVHIPTGTAISPNVKDTGQRDELLVDLEAAVNANGAPA